MQIDNRYVVFASASGVSLMLSGETEDENGQMVPIDVTLDDVKAAMKYAGELNKALGITSAAPSAPAKPAYNSNSGSKPAYNSGGAKAPYTKPAGGGAPRPGGGGNSGNTIVCDSIAMCSGGEKAALAFYPPPNGNSKSAAVLYWVNTDKEVGVINEFLASIPTNGSPYSYDNIPTASFSEAKYRPTDETNWHIQTGQINVVVAETKNGGTKVVSFSLVG